MNMTPPHSPHAPNPPRGAMAHPPRGTALPAVIASRVLLPPVLWRAPQGEEEPEPPEGLKASGYQQETVTVTAWDHLSLSLMSTLRSWFPCRSSQPRH